MFDLQETAAPALAERLRLFKIDQAAADLLAEASDRILNHLPPILDGFYDHIWQFNGAREILGSPDRFSVLKGKQSSHWAQLLSGRFDHSYYESARAVGMAHCRIGLEPCLYIGGYAYVQNALMAAVAGSFGDEAPAVTSAVGKALMLDLGLALSIYMEASAEEKQTAFASLASQLESQVQMVASTLVDHSATVKQSASDLVGSMQGISQSATAVAAASEQASVNVGTVAAATEELSASVREIGRQAVQSRDISDRAVTEADRATTAIEGLSTTAREIGNVLKLISDIASQTNLLALNATIEAARAGDAGRGFAVVASEVKSLANETARATGTISDQINAIQDAAQNTADVIGGIQGVIADMKSNATSIADAVEEQMAATNEISQNVQEAAAGTQQVTSEIYRISDQTGTADGLTEELAKVAGETEVAAVDLKSRVHEVIEQMQTSQG